MEEAKKIMERFISKELTNQTSLQTQEPKYNCPICKDVGAIFFIQDGYEFVKDCECLKARQYKEMYERSGIAKIFENKTLDNFTVDGKPAIIKAAKQIAQGYLRKYDGIQGIAFLGQVGSGKTHLCIAIANELLKRNIAVLYMQYREAITQLKQTITDEEVYQKQIWKYKKTPMLYVDDLFKGKITDSDKNIMFEIINYRYLNRLPVMVSSEFNTDKLLEFDEAIGSRIIEMCKGFIVELSGIQLNYRLGA